MVPYEPKQNERGTKLRQARKQILVCYQSYVVFFFLVSIQHKDIRPVTLTSHAFLTKFFVTTLRHNYSLRS